MKFKKIVKGIYAGCIYCTYSNELFNENTVVLSTTNRGLRFWNIELGILRHMEITKKLPEHKYGYYVKVSHAYLKPLDNEIIFYNSIAKPLIK